MRAIAKIRKCFLDSVNERIIVRQTHVLGTATHVGTMGNKLPIRPGLNKVAGIQKPLLQFA